MKTLITALLLLTATHAVQKELGEMFTKLQGDDKFTGRQTIAVMPFSTGEGVPADAGRTVSEFGVVSFHNSGRYTVVERQEFANMLAEQELAQSDLVNEETQLKMGKMLTASRLLVGSVTESFGQRMITSRILNVENGEVIATSTATVGPAAMDNFMKELLGEKGQVSATLIRSAVFPGWGQLYSSHPIRGGVSMGAFLAVTGYTVFTWFQVLDALDKRNERDRYMVNQWQVDANARAAAGEDYSDVVKEINSKTKQINQDYDEAFTYNQIWLGITAGVYILNLVDATFAGLSAKKKFDLYFSQTPGNRTSVQLSLKF